MGDNRNNSHDSRMWFGGQGGGVPFENIRGRALFVWLSVSDNGVDWSREGAPVMGRPRLAAGDEGARARAREVPAGAPADREDDAAAGRRCCVDRTDAERSSSWSPSALARRLRVAAGRPRRRIR